jgi:hypothetical protein
VEAIVTIFHYAPGEWFVAFGVVYAFALQLTIDIVIDRASRRLGDRRKKE